MTLSEYVTTAATEVALRAEEKIRGGSIRSVAELELEVAGGMAGILDVFMPHLKDEAATLLAPAAAQAVEAMKPAMYEVLRDWTPSFAAIIGGMGALSVLLGVWVSQQTYRRTRRNPSRRAA